MPDILDILCLKWKVCFPLNGVTDGAGEIVGSLGVYSYADRLLGFLNILSIVQFALRVL